MTTLTTVLGLVPMALATGDGAEIRQPMAITVIAGLACSTLLTLIVIPTVYALIDRLVGQQSGRSPAMRLQGELSQELELDSVGYEGLDEVAQTTQTAEERRDES